MKLPHVDLKKLRKFKKDNFKDRLEFIDRYTAWLKKTSNKKWSSGQKDIVGK